MIKAKLDHTSLLNSLSIELSQNKPTTEGYKEIIDAAVAIMDSQLATIQLLHPDRRGNEKLHLLASHGFDAEAKKYWEWIYHYTDSSCGEALRTRRRVIVPDYETCEFMQNSPT